MRGGVQGVHSELVAVGLAFAPGFPVEDIDRFVAANRHVEHDPDFGTGKGKICEVFNGEIVFGVGRLQGGVGFGGEKSVETRRDVIGRLVLIGFCKGFVVIVFKQIGVSRG
ncbi:MAG: hypothetical protein OXI23_05295 [Gemmatimonadota bacterium]|nr:hypothetical protein [Gemmatimonadota bacterium]